MFRPPLTDGAHAAALAVAYDDHHRALYRYCRGILHDEDDAQDAVQSTMERAFAALQRERREIELRPWLFRIAHNEAISIIRRRRPATRLHEVAVVDGDLDLLIARRDEFRSLWEDLWALSERQRRALLMRELCGLGHAEIARALDCSATAAKEAVAEARRALRLHRQARNMPCLDVRRTLSETDRRRWRGGALRAHLRTCPGCRRFAETLAAQRGELRSAGGPTPLSGAMALVRQLVTGPIAASGGWLALSSAIGQIAAIEIVTTVAVLATGAAGVAIHERLSASAPAGD